MSPPRRARGCGKGCGARPGRRRGGRGGRSRARSTRGTGAPRAPRGTGRGQDALVQGQVRVQPFPALFERWTWASRSPTLAAASTRSTPETARWLVSSVTSGNASSWSSDCRAWNRATLRPGRATGTCSRRRPARRARSRRRGAVRRASADRPIAIGRAGAPRRAARPPRASSIARSILPTGSRPQALRDIRRNGAWIARTGSAWSSESARTRDASWVSGSFVTISSTPSNPVRANNGNATSIGLEKTEIVEQMMGGRSSGTQRC